MIKFSYPENFQFLNMTTNSFMINNCHKLIVFLIYSVSFPIIVLILKRRNKKEILKIVYDSYFYSTTLLLVFMAYLPLGYSVFMEI